MSFYLHVNTHSEMFELWGLRAPKQMVILVTLEAQLHTIKSNLHSVSNYATLTDFMWLHVIKWQICSYNYTAGWYFCFFATATWAFCVYLFVCAPMWPAPMQCVRTCLYGEISRSNLGRARVSSGTNVCKSETDEYRSERTRRKRGSVGRRRWEKIRKSKSAIRLVVSL